MADVETLEPEQQEAPEALELEIPEDEEGEEEFAIELDGEQPEDEPPLIKTLREQIRDRDRELSTYRRAAAPKIEVGEKPTLEDYDYDEEKFSDALLGWTERKRQAENQEADIAKREQENNQRVQKRFVEYRAAATAMPVKDFDEAEKAVISMLPDGPDRPFQQVLLNYTKDPAKVVYALGKHPAKLQALSQETDPIRFAIELSKIEGNLKVITRRKPPEPERDTIQRGSAPLSNRIDKDADKALDKAQKSGNMDEYRKLMKARREKG